jgi:hypothetical protein
MQVGQRIFFRRRSGTILSGKEAVSKHATDTAGHRLGVPRLLVRNKVEQRMVTVARPYSLSATCYKKNRTYEKTLSFPSLDIYSLWDIDLQL